MFAVAPINQSHSPLPSSAMILRSVVPWLIVFGLSATPAYTQDLTGFRVMAMARQSMDVGAVWQQGVGTNGPGVPTSALRVSDAPNVTANRQFRAQVEGSIFTWLRLSGDVRRNSRLSFQDVKLVTVSDISELRPSSGNRILYEAIKVGTLRIETDNSTRASLRSRFGGELDSGGNLVLDGNDLFVAFRVITLQQPQITRHTARLADEREITMGTYRIQFRTGSFLNCMCSAGQSADMHAQEHECEDNSPVVLIVRNDARGQGVNDQYRVRLHHDGTPPPPIQLYHGQAPGAIEVDRLFLRVRVIRPAVTNASGQCVALPSRRFEAGGQAELVTTRYRFEPFRNPSAPGY